MQCSLCEQPACNKKWGWCWKHYSRWRRNGDPLIKGHGERSVEPGYFGMHQRVYAERGKATSCIWGCDHPRYEWANMSGELEDIWDYAQMCKTCHSRFDAAIDMMSKNGTWRVRHRPVKGSGPHR